MDENEYRRRRCGEDDWMHIYAQPFWHAEARIVGTRSALAALRDAIGRALDDKDGRGLSGAMAADGEGYWIEVEVSSYEALDKMDLPYIDIPK